MHYVLLPTSLIRSYEGHGRANGIEIPPARGELVEPFERSFPSTSSGRAEKTFPVRGE